MPAGIAATRPVVLTLATNYEIRDTSNHLFDIDLEAQGWPRSVVYHLWTDSSGYDQPLTVQVSLNSKTSAGARLLDESGLLPTGTHKHLVIGDTSDSSSGSAIVTTLPVLGSLPAINGNLRLIVSAGTAPTAGQLTIKVVLRWQ